MAQLGMQRPDAKKAALAAFCCAGLNLKCSRIIRWSHEPFLVFSDHVILHTINAHCGAVGDALFLFGGD